MQSADPECPSCSKPILFRHSATFWNPWDYPCPHCKVHLEASGTQKVLAIAALPAGAALAGIAIYFERSGAWQVRDSLVFFGFVAVGLVAGVTLSWKYTRFKIKGEQR